MASSTERCSWADMPVKRSAAIGPKSHASPDSLAGNMRDVVCAAGATNRRRGSGRDFQSRSIGEHSVGGDQRKSRVNGTPCDPEVVGVNGISQRVADTAANQSQFGRCREKTIADRNHGGCLDGLLEPSAPRLTPASEQCAISQLRDGRRRKEDPIACEKGDLLIEVGASSLRTSAWRLTTSRTFSQGAHVGLRCLRSALGWKRPWGCAETAVRSWRRGRRQVRGI